MSDSRGFTFIEVIMVVALFSVLFSVMIGVMLNSDTYFSKGQDKVTEQSEARRVLDTISRELRSAAPYWLINGTNYTLSITSNFTKLSYYIPVFDSGNNITGVRRMTYKINSTDSSQLLRRAGNTTYSTIADHINYVNFGAGCSGCASFNCTSLASDCPVVRLEVRTYKEHQFDLVTKIMLRNSNVTVANATEVDAPTGGEF
jgi:prepilin-type N-terminal cleavage/methylation domain-containing protein